jgi:hypothetical protein
MNNREEPDNSASAPSSEERRTESIPSAVANSPVEENIQSPANLPVRPENNSPAESTRPVAQTGIRWSDLANSDEVRALYSRVSVQDTLLRIRERGLRGGEKTIIVPANVSTELPILHERLAAAAAVSGMALLVDETQKMVITHKSAFSLNREESEAALASLSTMARARELQKVSTLAALISLLDKVPTKDDLFGQYGKEAFALISLTISGLYAEWSESVPIAESNRWWKITADVRSILIDIIADIVGGRTVATTLVNGIQILYRGLLREVFKNIEHPKHAELCQLAKLHERSMVVNGATMFQRSLRAETRKERQSIPDPKKKGTGNIIVERVVKGHVRPSIPTEPLTPVEAKVASALNRALANIEVGFDAINPTQYPCLKEWDKDVRSWVEDLYSRTSVVSKLVASRKQCIRASIITERKRLDSRPQVGGPKSNLSLTNISPEEWIAARSTYLTGNAEALEHEFHHGIQVLLNKSVCWEDLVHYSEDDFRTILRATF